MNEKSSILFAALCPKSTPASHYFEDYLQVKENKYYNKIYIKIRYSLCCVFQNHHSIVYNLLVNQAFIRGYISTATHHLQMLCVH